MASVDFDGSSARDKTIGLYGRARALSLLEETFQRADDCPWWIKGDVPDFVRIQTSDDLLRTMRRMVELKQS